VLRARRSPGSVEGLRKRLSNLLLRLIENPEFNPAAKLLSGPKPVSDGSSTKG
jgi:hypothetical protein